MSRVLARRRENWRGVRSGAFSGAEGKRVMWRGLFYYLLVLREEGLIRRMLMVTFLPITPRQAIEGMAVIIVLNVVRLTGSKSQPRFGGSSMRRG